MDLNDLSNHKLKSEQDSSQMSANQECKTPAAGDWIKELFTPFYDFDDIVKVAKDGYQPEESKIKPVPILDPVAIREVFERVHSRIVEAEKEKLDALQEKKEKELEKKIDPRSSSIWNTDEISTLRNVYKSAKGEIIKLEVALREQTAHSNSLQDTVLKQRLEIEDLKEKLKEASKSNKRLVIHRDSLQNDLAVLEVKLAALTDMWHEIQAEKVKAMEDTKSSHMELDKERLIRNDLEAKLLQAEQNLQREKSLLERNISSKYEAEIKDLQEVVRDLMLELQEERKLYNASKRGLEHLRNHFSSLPLQHILPPNAALKNEVEVIDHISLS
ncbi:uncharacterized protein PF3D7_1120000-like isoform X2 [Physella acuta]|uniref:uncharacterized protein PF3D7_1120000-like isoform X2 n=1 Tax=Physella acuta TaxID=109671 RepID=UPI0027DE6601|nr:uncharacterized protein PF3D7_1120000-like isoform X2 [Physella acuta]